MHSKPNNIVVPPNETFGRALRRLRENSGKDLSQLADFLKISVSTLSDIERGYKPPLSLRDIIRVLPFLGASGAELRLKAEQSRQYFVEEPRTITSEREEIERLTNEVNQLHRIVATLVVRTMPQFAGTYESMDIVWTSAEELTHFAHSAWDLDKPE